MIPIHELLAHIRWDPNLRDAHFEIAYLDRVSHRLVRLPLARITVEPSDHFAFEATEDDGSVHSVPYHRVRDVWQEGKLIWSRDARAPH